MTASEAAAPGRLLTGLACGLATALLWGSWAVVSRIGLTGALDHRDVTMMRFLVSGLVMLPFLFRLRIGRAGIAGIPWRAAAVMAFCGGAPYSLVVLAGIERAPAGHQAMVGPAAIMVLTVVLSRVFLAERMTARQYLGLVLIGAGVAGLSLETLLAGAAEIGFAHLLFLLAALMWSCFTVMARYVRADTFTATAIVSVASMLLYPPIYLFATGARVLSLPAGELLVQGLYQGLAIGLASLFLYLHAASLLGASRAALFIALVPGMGNLLAFLVLDEPLSPMAVSGLVAVTIGMAIALASGAVGPGRAAASAGQAGGVMPGSKP
ncbi:MAG: DMT family transporter [Alphaproteobacteria bacterium]|nr:DMT family transporter [Alphaproteobacteria bacterium]